MAELAIMKLFCDNKEMFEKYNQFVKSFKNSEREIKLMFNLIQDFYERYDQAEHISSEELMQFFDYQYPQSRERTLYAETISHLFNKEVRPELIQDLIEQYVEKHYATHIVNKLFPVMEGSKYNVLHEVKVDLDNYFGLLANPPVELNSLQPCELSIEELISQEINDEGLLWPWELLNSYIGGIRRKTLGLAFAYVDSGKTSFGMHTCACFAEQLKDTGETIVYAGNEESASRINLRLTQAFLQCLRSEITANPEMADMQRRENGFNRVKIYDSVVTTEQIDKLLDLHRPRILFVDQGTKIDSQSFRNRSGNEVTQMQQLFNYYRERAKQYDTSIMCLAQATGEAENRKFLKLTDLYGSRVAIQGELDYAIGIGRTDEKNKEDYRWFNVCKNKLMEGATGAVLTRFDSARCRFSPIGR